MGKWRVAKLLAAVGVPATLYVLHKNDWDVAMTGVARFGRAGLVVADIALDYRRNLYSGGLDAGSDEYAVLRSEIHSRSANKLLDLCCRNGGAFIKVGQHIGALDYLVPQEYVLTLKKLHSDAPKSELKDLLEVIRDDLKTEPENVFSHISKRPLGAASLAQVHKAVLRDTGETVAVKIQHPHVRDRSMVDTVTMEVLLWLVDKYFYPDFQFSWLAESMRENLPKELDFMHEARNMAKVRKMFSKLSWLRVPSVKWEYTTTRVLVMDYCPGNTITDVKFMEKNNISPVLVTERLGDLYSTMIFEKGFVHCDPHPGNILIDVDPENPSEPVITLLDHGLYQSLRTSFRLNYCHLWMSLLNRDVPGIKSYSRALNVGELSELFACMVTGRSWASIKAGISNVGKSVAEENEIRSGAKDYLPQISAVLNKVPREMLLIFKTNDLLRGLEHKLGTHRRMASFLTMSRSCVRAVASHETKRCLTEWCRFKVRLWFRWEMLKLNLYECYLVLSNLWHAFLGRRTDRQIGRRLFKHFVA